jgi:hypothetical protein
VRILADADALPGAVKELLLRAAERERVQLVMVANKPLRLNGSKFVRSELVAAGPDVADDRIVELAEAGDLVITADIPLADRAVSKGAVALDPRGRLYTEANVKDALAVRDLLNELRSGGLVAGGPSGYTAKDSQLFANELNSYLTKRLKQEALNGRA